MSFGMRYTLALTTVAVLSFAYWGAINLAYGVSEPWDAPNYFVLWYPLSIGLAALLGFIFADEGWQVGLVVIWIQYAVMFAWGAPFGPMFAIGIFFMVAMSFPAVIASAMGSHLKQAIAKRALSR